MPQYFLEHVSDDQEERVEAARDAHEPRDGDVEREVDAAAEQRVPVVLDAHQEYYVDGVQASADYAEDQGRVRHLPIVQFYASILHQGVRVVHFLPQRYQRRGVDLKAEQSFTDDQILIYIELTLLKITLTDIKPATSNMYRKLINLCIGLCGRL